MMHSIQTEGGAEHVRKHESLPVRDALSNAGLPDGEGCALFSVLQKELNRRQAHSCFDFVRELSREPRFLFCERRKKL